MRDERLKALGVLGQSPEGPALRILQPQHPSPHWLRLLGPAARLSLYNQPPQYTLQPPPQPVQQFQPPAVTAVHFSYCIRVTACYGAVGTA